MRKFIDDLDRVNCGRHRGGIELVPHVGGNAEGKNDAENEEDGEYERDFSVIWRRRPGSHGRVGIGAGSLVQSLSMRLRRRGHGMES